MGIAQSFSVIDVSTDNYNNIIIICKFITHTNLSVLESEARAVA